MEYKTLKNNPERVEKPAIDYITKTPPGRNSAEIKS